MARLHGSSRRAGSKNNDGGNLVKYRRSQAALLAISGFFATTLCSFTAVPTAAEPILMKLGTPTLNDGQHEFLKRL